MKNNKGFTLVELMGVIVVLAIIITIAVPSAISISAKIKNKMYDTKVNMIVSSAKMYGQDNTDKVSENESCSDSKGKILIQTLVTNGYIKKDDTENKTVIDPRDNSPMNEKKVCIYEKNNRVYAKLVE